jgi:hypothetical protein
LGVQSQSNVAERGIDGAGQTGHTRGRSESDEGYDERVLDKILAILGLQDIAQHLSFRVEFQKAIFHSYSFPFVFGSD